jgi:transcription antitermination factor NusA-like protein
MLVHVPKNYHSLVIGKNGNNLNRLKHDFNVQIEIPAKLLPEENVNFIKFLKKNWSF